jgi:aspartate/methionine/tyrosine aminotransferase
VKYVRMAMEEESPEQLGYDTIRYNLSESSVRDRTLSEIGVELPDMVLFYGEHIGHPGFRQLIAEQSGRGVTPDQVLVCAGAAHALFIIATNLLEPGDHLVVVRPNYATNIEVPRAIGADISYYDLRIEDGFRLDPERLLAMVTPRTKYVSVTVPHNPTGQVLPAADLRQIVAGVEAAGCRLLVDETYREMTFGELLPVAATLSDRVVSVSSLSKTYGIPGIRMGWIVCTDADLMYRFLSAKEQVGICNSVVDEEIGYQAFAQRGVWLPQIRARIAEAFVVVRDWMAGEELMEWVEPQGGVVCFPRIKPDVPLDEDEFYRLLLAKYGTYVGPGHWFEQSRRHMRVGYGWPTLDELKSGLAGISAAVRDAAPV